MSLAERISLCQLLSDVNLAGTRSYVLSELHSSSKEAHENLWHTVETLSQSGDIGGVILLLHSDLGRECIWCRANQGLAFELLHRLGFELSQRVSEILDKLDIKPGLEVKKALGAPGVLILPFAVMPHVLVCRHPWGEEFIRESLTWHWIRDSAMKDWDPEHPADWLDCQDCYNLSDYLEYGPEDIFGQTPLHISILLKHGDNFAADRISRASLDGIDVTSLGAKGSVKKASIYWPMLPRLI